MNTTRETRAPVFVDDSGRRWWIVRTIGWLLTTVALVAVALSAVALSVTPSVATTAHRSPRSGARLSAGTIVNRRP
jgi:hypothetical protein